MIFLLTQIHHLQSELPEGTFDVFLQGLASDPAEDGFDLPATITSRGAKKVCRLS